MTNQELTRLAVQMMYQAIHAAGDEGIPSGHLYARMMGYGMRLATYESILAGLVSAGLVQDDHHLLTARPLPERSAEC